MRIDLIRGRAPFVTTALENLFDRDRAVRFVGLVSRNEWVNEGTRFLVGNGKC